MAAGALALAAIDGCGASAPEPPLGACSAAIWVAAWAADPSDGLGRGLVGQTVRTILTPHLLGDTLRVHISNRFGQAPLTLGPATVALRGRAGAELTAGSTRPLRFGAAPQVTIPAGGDIVSDPVALSLRPDAVLAVSLFAAGATGPATEHLVGQQTSYLSPPGSGDHTGEAAASAFTQPTQVRYFVTGVDVMAPAATGAVVAFGDSITDGFGGPPDRDDRYPDFLARRLSAAGGPRFSVVDAGISGNRVLSDARAQLGGPAGLERLAGDAIGAAGVSDVIVLEGINDIAAQVAADRVIAGLTQLVARLHAARLRVQLATLTPFGGSSASSVDQTRLAVNRFVRGGGGADGTVDFDAAVRDPADASRLAPRYDSGDHLHPNAAGRRAMADAVDLAGLRAAPCRPG